MNGAWHVARLLRRDRRLEVTSLLYERLNRFLPRELTLEQFRKLPDFEVLGGRPAEEARQRVCTVVDGDRRVEVQIGTVASMKGETHLATLVLESYGHPAHRFDLAEALPMLAGLRARDSKMKESHLAQFRNLYVSMSRPTSFLCLAANECRVTPECAAALATKGWVVERLT